LKRERNVKMKNILVTGGAGFIGSNFVKMILDRHPDYKIINVDVLTYAGNLENLKDISNNQNCTFIKADIRNRLKIDEIFSSYDIDTVVNFAAESHVDRSIEEPEVFLTTNIIGTQVLLDVAKKHWKINPDNKYCKEYKPGVKFLQVSTDEVYGALGATGKFVETMPLLPNSPYSASKASADMIVRAYHETFGIPVNITRCSNNYGPYQFPEKLIPLMINNCLKDKELPVYGDGMQVRDWLHVSDHCSAIDTVLHKGVDGEIYNIGGNNEKANIEIVKLIIETLGKSEELIKYVQDRPGHDRRYAIDNMKITTQLGWEPAYSFEQGMKETIEWYLNNTEWIENIVSGDYVKYYEKMYFNLTDEETNSHVKLREKSNL
jgi:dTDP-glucose 4,6-dehydratase